MSLGDSKDTAQQNALDMRQDADLGSEMLGVPFASIIGGAFTAVTDAQNQATLTTINFIQSVGFKPSPDGNPSNFGEPIMVDFNYDKPGGIFGMQAQKHKVSVPFLTLIPLPSIRIQALKINFSVKLTQTRTSNMSFSYAKQKIKTSSTESSGSVTDDQRTSTSKPTTSSSTSADGQSTSVTQTGWRDGFLGKDTWNTSSRMFGTISDQAQNTHGHTVSREYTMKVSINAVQDDIPSGMNRVLDILTSIIERKADGGMSAMLQALASKSGGAGASAAASTASTASADTS